MILKAIEQLCKHSKIIVLLETEYEQWISDGYAIYPLIKMPKLTEETIFTVLNIPEDKKKKYTIRVEEMPKSYCIEDIADHERQIEKKWFQIEESIPLQTSQGVQFIQSRSLKPVSDIEQMSLWERSTEAGHTYFVVKDGMMIRAIVLPHRILSKTMVENLQQLANQCQMTLDNQTMEMEDE
ncbi:MAG: hypothetical protein CVU95_08445 [Firmicutes bacterium HGW-Firmicutes-2]|jgi:hypothetical protein|nr:MAG: hypothetical protein CVU95_08445 [Firmicutes bacterium HGW-Firmicutes-2]